MQPLNLVASISLRWLRVPIILGRHFGLDRSFLLWIQSEIWRLRLGFPLTRFHRVPYNRAYIFLFLLDVEWALKLIGIIKITIAINNSSIFHQWVVIINLLTQRIGQDFPHLPSISLLWQIFIRVTPWFVTCWRYILILLSILSTLLFRIRVIL